MNTAEILEGLNALLQKRLPAVPDFKLVGDEGWRGECPVSGQIHRELDKGEGGIWCTACQTAFIPDDHRASLRAKNLEAMGETIAGYLQRNIVGNRPRP